MGNLTNVTIGKVYKGASGTKDGREWQLYNFYVKGDKRKFSMFEKDEIPIPVEGMAVAFLEFKYEQTAGTGKHEGKMFDNYTVTKFVLPDDPGVDRMVPNDHAPKTPQPAQTQDIGKEAGIFASYHKDFICAMLPGFGTYEKVDFIADEMDKIIQLADEFLAASLKAGFRVTQAPKAGPDTDRVIIPKTQTGEPDDPYTDDDFPPVTDDIPFG